MLWRTGHKRALRRDAEQGRQGAISGRQLFKMAAKYPYALGNGARQKGKVFEASELNRRSLHFITQVLDNH